MSEWDDDKIKNYLDSLYPDVKITWFLFDDVPLYGFKGDDGMDYASADDDDVRSEAIQDFLKRRGGKYVSNS